MQKRDKINSKFLLITTVLVVALSTGGVLAYKKLKDTKPDAPQDKTTSTAPSAQEDFTAGGDRLIATPPEDKGTATVEDTGGQTTTTPDKEQWSTSSTGEITVYSPAKDKLLSNGDTVSGESTLPVVNYRVIDNVSGMISQGQLNVVGGKFSGKVSFTTKAANGRLDIYGASDSGREFGNVEISVKFK